MYMANEATVNKYWQAIWPSIESGELHAAAAKVSTKWGKQQEGNSKTYVIIVYTTKRRMDEVGRRLIKFFRRGQISYKTDEATAMGSYGSNTTIKTLKWPLMTAGESLSKAITAAAKQQQVKKEEEQHIIKLFLVGMKHNGIKSPEVLLQQPAGVTTRFFLHREADNKFDKHAIRVDYSTSCCFTNQQPPQNKQKKKKIGYITAEQVKLLSPWIDRGLVSLIVNNNDSDSAGTVTSSRLVSDTAIELSVTVLACRDAQEMLEAV